MKTSLYHVIALICMCIYTRVNSQSCLNKDIADLPVLHTQHSFQKNTAVDTFDIVFHVLHRGEPVGSGGNISDEQLLSAITALNRDFRALPIHDSISIRPNGADTRIQFRMACKDPNGNATNGIVRINASGVAGFDSLGIQFRPAGGGNFTTILNLSKWPMNKYINIWVSHRIEKPDGGITGGGGFGPGTPVFANGFGGAYMNHRYVGCDPDSSLGYNILNPYGRLISHEVGHFLGLLHTFNGDTCFETDCTTQGDQVCDTEPHSNSKPYDVSCNETIECGTREPVENIMNYSGITCGSIFTAGQRDRMKTVIQTSLQALPNQPACNQVTSINEWSIQYPFKLFPNPASTQVTVENSTDAEVSVYSSTGMLLFEQSMTAGKHHWQTDLWAPGMYIIRVKSPLGSRYFRLSVLQNGR
ncbi:MAG: zinc-dependent metalloprotease [Bacteroidota bacterium]|jgi:hypothetical protein